MPTPSIRAALFDLDGTLIDSLDDLAGALAAALVNHELPVPTREVVKTWIGGGARVLVAHAVAPALVEPVLARFRVHYRAAPVVHTHVYAGLGPVLDALAAAGTRLAVLTNKPHDLAVTICERLLAPWPFAPVVGARDGVPLKPDPTAALAIARELQVAPDACAFIGDSAIDLKTAHAAGMMAVAVSWGFRPRAELEVARPALLADDPAQLRALLGR